MFATADLCDAHGAAVQVVEPFFRDYGGTRAFSGPIATVKAHEDNTSVRALLETAGQGRVLVVDGGGSLNCALVGDQLARLGAQNGWAGVVVYGCVRDAGELEKIPFGVKALGVNPRRSEKKGPGEVNLPVTFAGTTFEPGHYLYADADGIITAAEALT